MLDYWMRPQVDFLPLPPNMNRNSGRKPLNTGNFCYLFKTYERPTNLPTVYFILQQDTSDEPQKSEWVCILPTSPECCGKYRKCTLYNFKIIVEKKSTDSHFGLLYGWKRGSNNTAMKKDLKLQKQFSNFLWMWK